MPTAVTSTGVPEGPEYGLGILKQVEDYKAGRLKTYSLDEVGEMLGLDASRPDAAGSGAASGGGPAGAAARLGGRSHP